MKNATKLILLALALLVALVVVWSVVGIVVTIAKFVLFLAVILIAVTIFRKLSGKAKPEQLEEKYEDRELNEAMKRLEEIKRSQLIK